MTEQFFGKELAARKIEAIPGMILCRRKITK